MQQDPYSKNMLVFPSRHTWAFLAVTGPMADPYHLPPAMLRILSSRGGGRAMALQSEEHRELTVNLKAGTPPGSGL